LLALLARLLALGAIRLAVGFLDGARDRRGRDRASQKEGK
jgi:hypothetical protein